MIPLGPATLHTSLNGDLGGEIEQSYVTPDAANTGSFESFVITCPAGDEAAQADYFSFSDPGGHKFAVWLDIDANGTTPTGAIYTAADSKVEVDIVLTGTPDTAAEVAGKLVTAIEAELDFTEFAVVDNADGTLTFTANLLGNPADAAPHNTGDTGAGTFLASATSGSAASDQNEYFVLRDDDTGLFHVWLNVNSEGVDPDPGGGSVGIEVAVAAEASLATVTAAIASAVNAHAEFEAEVDGDRVKVTTASKAAVTDLSAGDIGYTVEVKTQGHAAQKQGPATAVSGLTNF